MATVYLAEDVRRRRRVAVKVLKPGATERALVVLEEAVDKGFYAYEFMTKYCPFMAPLRGLAEYERIMEKARGRWEAFARAVA